MSKVSVIIPVYNTEKYLKKCLNSIINQTLKDIEIIIVNDGSTDNSLNICNEFVKKDERIKLINKENEGLSAARNTGLKLATGEYIGFVDSDDWLSLDFYEKLYENASQNDADIAYGDIVRKSNKIHKLRRNLTEIAVFTDNLDKIYNIKNLSLGCVWDKIYRKSLLDNNNLEFEKGVYYEDGRFLVQAIYYANKIVSVPNIYYYYFINPKSIVKSQRTQKKIDDKIMCRIFILNFLADKKIKLKKGEFLTVIYKIRLFGLTLFVIKEDNFVKVYYLFGSIPLIQIDRNVHDDSLFDLIIKIFQSLKPSNKH